MAKTIYLGVSSKARKTKKAYIGVGGKAHEIKKIYVGVGGKARLAYTSYVPLTSFSLSYTVTDASINGNSVTFKASFVPANATDKTLTWTWSVEDDWDDNSNRSVSAAENTNGTYTLTVSGEQSSSSWSSKTLYVRAKQPDTGKVQSAVITVSLVKMRPAGMSNDHYVWCIKTVEV